MCGIVCYTGTQAALPLLLQGLRMLEYRGYDSAGVGLIPNESKEFVRVREFGEVKRLVETLATHKIPLATCGIGHTRWASHGSPSVENAHPHQSCDGRVMLVHNGDLEDHLALRRELEARKHVFRSETDTEVIAHLLEEGRCEGLGPIEAINAMRERIRGTYALGIVFADFPDRVYLTKFSGSLVLGKTPHGVFAMSDTSAMLPHTREVVRLQDHDLAMLTPDGFEIYGPDVERLSRPTERLEGSAEDLEKNGHPHFMRKEFSSQPDSLKNVLRGRLDLQHGTAVLGGISGHETALKQADRVIITGCGSAYYAGLIGKRFIESFAGIPTHAVLANQFPFDTTPITTKTVVISITQSGVTADTVEAQREAKRRGALTLGIVNAVGTTIPTENDGGIYLRVGTESGVASTKAFTAQATALGMFALSFGRLRGKSFTEGLELAQALSELPAHAEQVLKRSDQLAGIIGDYRDARSMYFLGAGAFVPTVLEGALKLKEIAYIHAEAYASGEMKHGPLALLEKDFPVLVLAPKGPVSNQTASALAKVHSIGARILLVTDSSDLNQYASHVIELPPLPTMTAPILWTIVLQRFAYEVAVAKGLNPDRPRHLAKAITVR